MDRDQKERHRENTKRKRRQRDREAESDREQKRAKRERRLMFIYFAIGGYGNGKHVTDLYRYDFGQCLCCVVWCVYVYVLPFCSHVACKLSLHALC